MAGQRRALIVANDEYEHEGLRRLLAPAADAEALSRVLGDPQIGDFDVQVVRNEAAHVVQARIEDVFSESRADDVLLLHFSCHGLKSESGELFFAARNTRPNRLGSTAVPADFVQRCMRATRSRCVVLFLDCCYGGSFGQGVTVRAGGDAHVLDSFPRQELGGGRGRAVITASSAMEYAFEGGRLADDHSQQPSVFTTALVQGLATGDADRDEDGRISLDELYDYVFDRVRAQNPHQTPSRDVKMQGEFYVARSRRRRVRAERIPPDLEAARTDPNMYARFGAVAELRSRLASENLPAAAGAYNALTDTVRNDIQYVAHAAAAALGEAQIRPAETELHFGRVEQGCTPPHHVVPLLGPPIARACTVHASEDWIRVDKTTDGLDIWIDTAEAGRRHGTVEVKGTTGAAVITIDADVVPPPPSMPVPPSREHTESGISASPPAQGPHPEGPQAAPLPPQPRRDVSTPRPGTPTPVVSATTHDSRKSFDPALGSTAMPSVRSGHPSRTTRLQGLLTDLWVVIPVLSLGFAAPFPIVHAAIRLRERRLLLIASAYTGAWLSALVVIFVDPYPAASDVARFVYVCLVILASGYAGRLSPRVFAPRSAPPPADP
jgi:hypothetical protein